MVEFDISAALEAEECAHQRQAAQARGTYGRASFVRYWWQQLNQVAALKATSSPEDQTAIDQALSTLSDIVAKNQQKIKGA